MMFLRRANTELIHQRRMATVQQFIEHLGTAGGIVLPVDDLLVGAHANSSGQLFIPMFQGQRGPTTFEVLQETVANAASSVTIPDAIIGHNPGDPLTHSLHLKGCNIGKAHAFLVKFKEALGNHVNVTAPKHFHGLSSEPSLGIFEWMAYEFSIRRSAAFPDRNTALADFRGAGFTLIDGSAVPNAEWENWIPRNIARFREDRIASPLGVTIGRRTTLSTLRQFRVDRFPYTYIIAYPSAADVPGTRAERLQALEQGLQAHADFQAAHPFPMYQRLGYASVQEFFAGYSWSFSKNRTHLVCRGDRFEYTVVVPITAPATGNLVFNFYPDNNSPHAPSMSFLEGDPTYFERV